MFEIPEDISALSTEDLNAALATAIEEANELAEIPDEDFTDEQLERFEALAEFINAGREEAGNREQAATSRTERLAAARQVTAADEGEGDDEGEGEEDDEGDDEGEESRQTGEGDDEGEGQREGEGEQSRQAASSRRTYTRRAARRTPRREDPPRAVASITAAGDVPGYSAGQSLEGVSGLGEAVSARLKGLPRGGGGKRQRFGIASIRRGGDNVFQQEDFRNDTEALMAVASEKRLDKGNLAAAGGWGAPSQTVYDLCPMGEANGLFDLPEITITRGGMQYTKGLTYSDIANSASGFIDQTEAQAEAGEAKTSLRPGVPDFTEVRLDAVGVFVEAGLLLRVGYPEVVEQTVQAALLVHQHKVSTKLLNGVRAYTGAAFQMTTGAGNAVDVLNLLEVVVVGERQRERLPENATMEVLLPHWVKNVVRADLSNRTGVDMLSVTDRQIEAYFRERNFRVQWLHNMQEIDLTTDGIATSYPDNVEAIVYQAGTYVKGTADIITLDTVYDSTNLRQNDYIELFLEEGVLVANPCGNGRRVNIPLTISGRTAAADLARFLNRPSGV